MLRARAASICAWRGNWLRSAVRNCGGAGREGEGKATRSSRFWTRIGPIDRCISRSMGAGWGRPQPRCGLLGRCGVWSARKKALDLQIGSGGAIQVGMGGLLELLLCSRDVPIPTSLHTSVSVVSAGLCCCFFFCGFHESPWICSLR
jgi:hypothetical protein